jgi:hypothetical protein
VSDTRGQTISGTGTTICTAVAVARYNSRILDQEQHDCRPIPTLFFPVSLIEDKTKRPLFWHNWGDWGRIAGSAPHPDRTRLPGCIENMVEVLQRCMRVEGDNFKGDGGRCNRSLPSFLGRGGGEQQWSVGPVRTRPEPAPKGYEYAEGEGWEERSWREW